MGTRRTTCTVCGDAPCYAFLSIQLYSAWRASKPEPCTKKSLPPLAGDGAPMKKMLAFFSWVPGKVAAGRKGEYKTSIYPARQALCLHRLAGPVFTPLGGHPGPQCLSRLAAALPSSKTQHLSRLARVQARTLHEKSLPPLAGDGAPMKKMLAFFSWVPGKVAAGRKGGVQNQHLRRLAVQYLRRLAGIWDPSIYPAWRFFTSPNFMPRRRHKP